MPKKILITCALPYANGPLHFGHIAGAYLPGDAYARFCRLKGADVLFLCGSDEYGVAITMSADIAGRSYKEHVDIYHKINKEFFKTLDFSFDHYSRTTWPGHQETVQEFFLELLHNGYIEPRVTDQLYCPEEKKFLADRYVVGICPKCQFEAARGDECGRCGASFDAVELIEPKAKMSLRPLVKKPTKHWFLLLDKFKEPLTNWVAKKDWKSNVLQFAKNYIQDLHPRAITRDSTWGIPVPLPDADGKVLYVWFDAPIGYISAAKEWALDMGKKEAWKDYWLDQNTELVQFVGKDNIPFHAAIFPAMIMGQSKPYKLVDELPANEFYNLEGRQFSKSENWTIDLQSFFHHFSADQIRYAIAANAPEASDAEFTWSDFLMRCNSDLVGKLGNFANRCMSFIHKEFAGAVPAKGQESEYDKDFFKKVQEEVEKIDESYQRFRLRKAASHLMELAAKGNAYFDHKKPWKAAKDPALHQDLQNTLHASMQCLKALALCAYPLMPSSAQKLWQMLGMPGRLQDGNWQGILEQKLEAKLGPLSMLFAKVEPEVIEAMQARLHSR